MSKFHKGQKVFVLPYYPMIVVDRMKRFIGSIVTISSAPEPGQNWPYRIEEDPKWVWSEKSFGAITKIRIEANNPNFIFKQEKEVR